jgi:hypothetical protein
MTRLTNETYTVCDIMVRAAAFVTLTTASAALLALPYMGTARSAAEDSTGHSARLQAAFEVAAEMPEKASLRDVLLRAARKGDRLTSTLNCGAQTWPWIHPKCLTGSEEASLMQPVRTVTVEYRLGENRSALVRLPMPHLAAQP